MTDSAGDAGASRWRKLAVWVIVLELFSAVFQVTGPLAPSPFDRIVTFLAIPVLIVATVFALRELREDARQGYRFAVFVVILVFAATLLVLAVVYWAVVRPSSECASPEPLSVMVPEDGAAGFAEVLRDFGAADGQTSSAGCPEYHLTSYGASWSTVRDALGSGWRDTSAGGTGSDEDRPSGLALVPGRDLGPRPDVWIMESRAQWYASSVVNGGGQVPAKSPPRTIGESPLVRVTTSGEPGGTYDPADLDGVVRPAPETSMAALFHTALVHRAVGARTAEATLSATLGTYQVSAGTDPEQLCTLAQRHQQDGEDPGIAVLTSERTLLDLATGGGCPELDRPEEALVAAYPERDPEAGDAYETELEYAASTLTWDGDDPAAGAHELVEWLTTPEGRSSLAEHVHLRAPGGSIEQLRSHLPGPAMIDEENRPSGGVPQRNWNDLADAADRARELRPAARVLFVVDSSDSMRLLLDAERSRFDAASEAVEIALGHLRPDDEAALLDFSGRPAPGDGTPPEVTFAPVTAGMFDAALGDVAARLADPGRNGRTPLYGAVRDGVLAMAGEGGDGAAVPVVVVLTDGRDSFAGKDDLPGYPYSAGELSDDLGAGLDAEVRLHVLAVGEVTCDVVGLDQVAEELGGACRSTDFAGLEATVADLFSRIGGR